MPQQKPYKILLIGDSCIDEYVYGTCERLNPEAPVPILKFNRKESKSGMAGMLEIISNHLVWKFIC
jgi:D-glycero-beta-D-manno-heptose-7-phosphate kinase